MRKCPHYTTETSARRTASHHLIGLLMVRFKDDVVTTYWTQGALFDIYQRRIRFSIFVTIARVLNFGSWCNGLSGWRRLTPSKWLNIDNHPTPGDKVENRDDQQKYNGLPSKRVKSRTALFLLLRNIHFFCFLCPHLFFSFLFFPVIFSSCFFWYIYCLIVCCHQIRFTPRSPSYMC